MLKLIFLVLSHPINLHYRDEIYYMVLATILLHNMMVEERIRNDETEEKRFMTSSVMTAMTKIATIMRWMMTVMITHL